MGQTVEIAPRAGYEFYFNAMFDRVDNAARGLEGGFPGEQGAVELTDGTKMRGKGRQLVKNGKRLRLRLPGGGGYGKPTERSWAKVHLDLIGDYITDDQAREDFGFDE